MQTVTVYYFECYDVKTDKFIRSKRPAKWETIEALGHLCRVIEDSAKEVNVADLDGDGFLAKKK